MPQRQGATELLHHTRLADTRLTPEQKRTPAAGVRELECAIQLRHLLRPAEERRLGYCPRPVQVGRLGNSPPQHCRWQPDLAGLWPYLLQVAIQNRQCLGLAALQRRGLGFRQRRFFVERIYRQAPRSHALHSRPVTLPLEPRYLGEKDPPDARVHQIALPVQPFGVGVGKPWLVAREETAADSINESLGLR